MRLVCVVLACAAACSDTTAPKSTDGGANDAAVVVDASAQGDAHVVPDSAIVYDLLPGVPPQFPSACINSMSNGGDDGHHNAGQDCTNCHGFTIAGTVLAGASSATAVSNAVIDIEDATGSDFQLISATNGNFYTSVSFVFPVRVRVSKCPSNEVMTDLVVEPGGGCNQSGCHAAGNRIHLP
jgi:hypothetical protein